jgi:hypothetical protein
MWTGGIHKLKASYGDLPIAHPARILPVSLEGLY